ncbi:MAG: chorismate mutase [Synechococcales cyanobacterium RU_4_20]|nr:chorismate mutase [Synechococcales cyanobacterium RU_4_20]NJR68244.1 chorismate mutase [Synechococcales cyanobacterium CRU_2_2]
MIQEERVVSWQVQAIRGATTVSDNSAAAIREAVTELMDALEANNEIKPQHVVSLTFSVTRDLDALFPASVARKRPGWDNVPLLDVQQMHVTGSLERCIRLLLHINCPEPNLSVHHPYLRQAQRLRPDWDLARPMS